MKTTHYLDNKLFEKTILIFQSTKRNKLKYLLILEDLENTLEKLKKRNKKTSDFEILLDNKRKEYEDILNEYNDSQTKLAFAFAILSEKLAK